MKTTWPVGVSHEFRWLQMKCAFAAIVACASSLSADDLAADPLFDFQAIRTEPLDAKVLKERTSDGVLIQNVEFAGPEKDGKPVRVFGILAYPAKRSETPT